jgi:segregation and condensation protein B
VTENHDERAKLGGHWEGLDRFLGAAAQPADPEPADTTWPAETTWPADTTEPAGATGAAWSGAAGEAGPTNWTFSDEPSSWADAISSAYPIVPNPAGRSQDENESAARAGAGFQGIDSWVPPWAREAPAAASESVTYAEEEMALGRFAYAETDGEQLPDPDAFEPGMSDAQLRGALEAILMVVNEPVSLVVLAQVLEEPTNRIDSMLYALRNEYANQGRGFELRQVAGGWRFYTRGQFSSYVERFVLDGQQIRLTQAALETLAVVAYKQPVTRSRVAAIRGVNCDGVIKTLVTRGLVEECGSEPDSGAHLYRTTSLFLEKVGINSVEELPSIAPFLPDDVDEFDLAQR